MMLFWQGVLSSRDEAVAVWVQCGHEIRLEARKQLIDLVSFIVHPTAGLIGAGLLTLPEPADVTPANNRRAGKSKTTSVSNPAVTVGTKGLKSGPPSLPPSIKASGSMLTSPSASSIKTSATSDSGVKMSDLLAMQANTEAAFKQSVAQQQKRQDAFERERAEKLAKDQEDRRLRWEADDKAKLDNIRKTMSKQQEQRHREVCCCDYVFVLH